jgi:hypothetical protein
MTAEDPLERHKTAPAKAVFLHRFVGIFRAGGYITATGGEVGRNSGLIKPNEKQRCLPYEYHRSVSTPHKAGLAQKPGKLL